MRTKRIRGERIGPFTSMLQGRGGVPQKMVEEKEQCRVDKY